MAAAEANSASATGRSSGLGGGSGSGNSGGGGAADSYIGSLISLTSKSEIRYEGILYNINTEESSIGLRNVRSFGTEGRKKDGPQVPSSDKVYEYILFRGSDIKDLQVKSSPPVQTAPPPNNDPAIIQSHYPHPASTSTSVPSASGASFPDLNSHSSQLGHPGSNFQGQLPLYQPSGNLGSWGASPSPSANGSGLGMPMYWPGYYNSTNGLAHMNQQQPLLRPQPGLSMPSSVQQPLQYPNYNISLPTGATNLPTSNLAEVPSPLLPASTSSINMTSTLLPSMLSSNLPQAPSATLPTETHSSSTPNLAASSSLPSVSFSAPLLSAAPPTTGPEPSPIAPPISNKTSEIPGQALPYQSSSYSTPSVGVTNSVHTETPRPSLITPGQLMQSGPNSIPTSQPPQMAHKDVEVVQVSSSPAEATVPVATEAQPPILPLPVPSRTTQKPNGAPFHNRYGYRGRERGRGTGGSRPVTRFTEDFDFEAMNEKFNKDEVWGHLGKSSKSHLNDNGGNGEENDEDDSQEQYDTELQKIDGKPVYNKDDFFDTLSCNALDQNGRTRFSEQLKLDTETFGDFARYRGGRGGRGPNRGGRFRGGYYGHYGRGYGYGYGGRGRGRGMSSRAP